MFWHKIPFKVQFFPGKCMKSVDALRALHFQFNDAFKNEKKIKYFKIEK